MNLTPMHLNELNSYDLNSSQDLGISTTIQENVFMSLEGFVVGCIYHVHDEGTSSSV